MHAVFKSTGQAKENQRQPKRNIFNAKYNAEYPSLLKSIAFGGVSVQRCSTSMPLPRKLFEAYLLLKKQGSESGGECEEKVSSELSLWQ